MEDIKEPKDKDNKDKEIKIYIKRLSGDILEINIKENIKENPYNLNKKVISTLEDIKEDFTIYHPYKVYYRSILYPNRPPEKNILYFPPSISHYRHPYRIFPLEVEEEGLIKNGDIYGIISHEDLRANIDFSRYFNSNDKYKEFYVFIYKIHFKFETIIQNGPYKDPEVLYIFQTIEIRLLTKDTLSSLVIPYSEVSDINENISNIKEKSMFDAFYYSKELSDFSSETRTSIINELINFIDGKFSIWDISNLIELDGF